MPSMPDEVALWGDDAELRNWLVARGVGVRGLGEGGGNGGEVILISGRAAADVGEEALAVLTGRIERGATAVLLTPEALSEGDLPPTSDWQTAPVPLRWRPLPSAEQPSLGLTPNWYFRADHWAKEHPIFEGLPCGGIMDYRFYREILTNRVLVCLEPPLEAVSGALQTTGGRREYRSDLLVSVHNLGAGRLILNSLRIRENLGKVPAAEHLLRNMLKHAQDRA